MKIKLVVGYVLCSFLYVSMAVADTITVGIGAGYDFPTIQQAINAASSGDYVDISDGSYTEDLVVSGKDLIITGNSLSPNAVTVIGSVTIAKGTDTEIQYLTIDASGKPYGIKTAGTTDVKYGRIVNGRYGILVQPRGNITLYDQTVAHATAHGIYSKRRAQIRVEDSILDYNGKSGIKVVNNRKRLYVTESLFSNNRTGAFMMGSAQKNYITKTNFTSNKIAIKLKDASAYTSDNVYTDNVRNVVRAH